VQGSLKLLANLLSQGVSMATSMIRYLMFRFDVTGLVCAELLFTWFLFLFTEIILLLIDV